MSSQEAQLVKSWTIKQVSRPSRCLSKKKVTPKSFTLLPKSLCSCGSSVALAGSTLEVRGDRLAEVLVAGPGFAGY